MTHIPFHIFFPASLITTYVTLKAGRILHSYPNWTVILYALITINLGGGYMILAQNQHLFGYSIFGVERLWAFLMVLAHCHSAKYISLRK